MTFSKALLAASLIVTAPLSANAAEVLIDFEDQATFTRIGDAYIGLGVVFSSDGEDDPNRLPVVQNVASYGPTNVLADLSRDAGTFNIRGDFIVDVTDLSVDVTSADGRSTTVETFDAFGSLLQSKTSAVGDLGTYETLTFDGPVAWFISKTSTPTSSGTIIDNVRYSIGGEVPLPAGLPLLLGGLAAFGLMRRKG